MSFLRSYDEPESENPWFDNKKDDLYIEISAFFDKISSPKYSRIIGKTICEAYLTGEYDGAARLIDEIGAFNESHVYAYLNMDQELKSFFQDQYDSARINAYED